MPDVPLENAAAETRAEFPSDPDLVFGPDELDDSDPIETLDAEEAIGEAPEPVPENPEEEAEDEQAAEEALAEAEAIEAPAEPAEPASELRNPWQSRRAINWFTRARRLVLRGRDLRGRTESALRRHVQRNRDGDPRPHLLLAQSYMNRGWKRSALERYDLARRVDPNAAADPRMKLDLVRLAADSSVQARAAQVVAEVYGADAAEVIDAELQSDRWDDAAKGRLRTLRGSLQ